METKALAPIAIADVRQMAEAAAKSGLMPAIRTPEAAFTLMMLCQAEGLHPIQALRRYHIIEGRPSMRSDAMLSDFQRAGGTIEWVKTTAEECEAIFAAPGVAKPVTVRWSAEDARRAGLFGKGNWAKFPAQMLRARTVSDGVRMTMPGVVAGIYTPEEVQDFDPEPPSYTPPTAPEKAPLASVPLSSAAPPAEVEHGSRKIDPVRLKQVIIAVTKLGIGEKETEQLGIRGKAKDDFVRPMRINWVGEVIGRKIESTKDLTYDEADKVLLACVRRELDKDLDPTGAA